MSDRTTLTDEELAAIEARAHGAGGDAATWRGSVGAMSGDETVVGPGGTIATLAATRQGQRNGAHIAGMDPPTTLRLCAALRAERHPRRCDDAAQAWQEVKEGLAREADLRAKLAIVYAHVDNVWRWQGDGLDHPESLSCPVVMSAGTLRAMVARADAAETRATTAEAESLKIARAGLRADQRAERAETIATRAVCGCLFKDCLKHGAFGWTAEDEAILARIGATT